MLNDYLNICQTETGRWANELFKSALMKMSENIGTDLAELMKKTSSYKLGAFIMLMLRIATIFISSCSSKAARNLRFKIAKEIVRW